MLRPFCPQLAFGASAAVFRKSHAVSKGTKVRKKERKMAAKYALD
jgi:hypothetical protein